MSFFKLGTHEKHNLPYTTPAETQGYYMYMKYMCSKVQKNNPHFLHFTYRRCLAVFVAITYQKWHY